MGEGFAVHRESFWAPIRGYVDKLTRKMAEELGMPLGSSIEDVQSEIAPRSSAGTLPASVAETFASLVALYVNQRIPEHVEWPSQASIVNVDARLGLDTGSDVSQVDTTEPSPMRPFAGYDEIPIDGLLGHYIASEGRGLIELFVNEINECAGRLGVDYESLWEVVAQHEAGHAIVHVGEDAGTSAFGLDAYKSLDGGAKPGPLHEMFAQLICYHSIKGNDKLLDCFLRLNHRQSGAYLLWQHFRDVSLEQIRVGLIGLRQRRIAPDFHSFSRYLLSDVARGS